MELTKDQLEAAARRLCEVRGIDPDHFPGGRLLSVWTRPEHPTVWVLTDDYGGSSAVTTALFPEDY